ncbi:hypothetical protein HDU76_005521, partial [Blyttiomyces sp. JEL0837]
MNIHNILTTIIIFIASVCIHLASTQSINSTRTNTTARPSPIPQDRPYKLIGYWGQNVVAAGSPTTTQSSLLTYCTSQNWDIIILAFLSQFGGSDTAFTLNLANYGSYIHPNSNYDPSISTTFKSIGQDIQSCQEMGIQILLAIGGIAGSPYRIDTNEAGSLSKLINNAFLSGNSSDVFRPFGEGVILDGIDFDIEQQTSQRDIAIMSYFLKGLNPGRNVMITASPQCFIGPFNNYIDANVGTAIAEPTLARFDLIQIQFYNNPSCDLNSGMGFNFDLWTTLQGPHQTPLAVIIPGSVTSSGSGFVSSTDVLKNQILRVLGNATLARRFYGVGIWDVSSSSFSTNIDPTTKLVYSSAVRSVLDSLPPPPPPPPPPANKAITNRQLIAPKRKYKLIGYWGQNTVSASNTHVNQSSLLTYCNSQNWDIIILSLLSEFGTDDDDNHHSSTSSKPPLKFTLNFANFGSFTSPDSKNNKIVIDVFKSIGKEIKLCQFMGIKILLGLGGNAGSDYKIDKGQGENLANLIHDAFFGYNGGSGSGGSGESGENGDSDSDVLRPFGDDVVLDGVNFDLEQQTSQADIVTFTRVLKELNFGRNVMITASPQCYIGSYNNYIDANLGTAIADPSAEFDLIQIQFYNNPSCDLTSGDGFNFKLWLQLAGPSNPPLAITIPGSSSSSGSGFVDKSDIIKRHIEKILDNEQQAERFYGIAVWDVSSSSLSSNVDASTGLVYSTSLRMLLDSVSTSESTNNLQPPTKRRPRRGLEKVHTGSKLSISSIPKRSYKLIGYWGQNVVSHDTPSPSQSSLSSYCQTKEWDIIIISVLLHFGTGTNLQDFTLNLANFGTYYYPGSDKNTVVTKAFLDVGKDIKLCQGMGIKILLSIGGSTSDYKIPSGQGSAIATILNQAFLSGVGSKVPRPFGNDVILDGIDFDLEHATSQNDVAVISGLLKSLNPGKDILVSVDAKGFNFGLWTGLTGNHKTPLTIAIPGSMKSSGNGYVGIQAVKSQISKIMENATMTARFYGITVWDVSSSSINVITKSPRQTYSAALRSLLDSLPVKKSEPTTIHPIFTPSPKLQKGPIVAGYWGQNVAIGELQSSLATQCATGHWNVIYLSRMSFLGNANPGFLLDFGPFGTYQYLHGVPPSFSSMKQHEAMKRIGRDIKFCQKMGVQVALSVGFESKINDGYNFVAGDAELVGLVWLAAFFGGVRTVSKVGIIPRPFGDGVVLDGIEFVFENYVDQIEIAKLSGMLSSVTNGDILITATTQCTLDSQGVNPYIGKALTDPMSHFDIIQIQFFDNSCHLGGAGFINYMRWVELPLTSYPKHLVIGLPGSATSTSSGYVPPPTTVRNVVQDIVSNG